MGLFDKKDKKRKDDFDSPVDQVDLGASSRPTTPEPSTPVAKPAAAAAPEPAPSSAPAASTPAPEPPRPAPAPAPSAPVRASAPESDDYGIDKAIELMRTLPQENIELVVQVVKFSLESVGIHLPTIIQDAVRRENDLQGRIASLKAEIAELEAEIKQRRDEITKHEADHKETSTVRDRLELAEKLGKGGKTPAASAAASSSSSDASSSGAASSSLPSLGGTPHRSHSATGQTAVIPPKK